MKARPILLLVVLLALAWDAPPGWSQKGERWDRRENAPMFHLRVPNAGGVTHWRIAPATGGITLQVGGVGKYAGWYLNYDHRGKDATVLLSPEPGPGCVWILSEVRRGEIVGKAGDGHQDIWATITAAEGPVEGWYLAAEGRARLQKERSVIRYRIDVFDRESGK
jgi:hypothetical protein